MSVRDPWYSGDNLVVPLQGYTPTPTLSISTEFPVILLSVKRQNSWRSWWFFLRTHKTISQPELEPSPFEPSQCINHWTTTLSRRKELYFAKTRWQVLKGKCYDGRQNMIRNLIAYGKTFNEFDTFELSTNKSLLSGFLLYCFLSNCLGSKNKWHSITSFLYRIVLQENKTR